MALTKVYTNMIADTAISVQSYGAKGDGVTDDSAAINAAITALGYAYLPKPAVSYYVASPILVDRNQRVFGDASGFYVAEDANFVPLILAKRGAPAIWIQRGFCEISNVTIEFDKADKTDFSDPEDVGIRVRAVNAFSPNPPASWDWTPVVLMENITISRAYMSIEMEAVYRGSLSQINTYYDKFGVSLNYYQSIANGGGAVPKYATTMWYTDVYCRGATGAVVPPPAGGFGFWGSDNKDLSITNCVVENYDQAIYMFNTSSGTMRNLSSEGCSKGVDLQGNLTPFIVENPFILYQTATTSTYAFTGNFGEITFIGGTATLFSSATCVFFRPVVGGTNSKATFLKKPGLVNAFLTPFAGSVYDVNDYSGGVFPDNSLMINGGMVFQNTFSSLVSGVATKITPVASTATGGGGIVHVTSYSLKSPGPSDYQALVSFMPGLAVNVIFVSNNTGGTVAFTVVSGALYITSTGTAQQTLQEVNARGIMN